MFSRATINTFSALMPSFLFTCFVNHQGGKRALEARQLKMEEKSAKSRALTSYNEPQDLDDGSCSSASRRTKAVVMRQRREKVKFRLKGKEVVEVVWSRPVRIAFLAHLVLRGLLEIAFIIIGYVLQGKAAFTLLRWRTTDNLSVSNVTSFSRLIRIVRNHKFKVQTFTQMKVSFGNYINDMLLR